MVTLCIHHAVPQFEAWKRAFDSDPLNRKASGVRRYRVFRGVADPNVVMVDLEFETLAEAEAVLARLHRLGLARAARSHGIPKPGLSRPSSQRT
jgi:hypothetical protein